MVVPRLRIRFPARSIAVATVLVGLFALPARGQVEARPTLEGQVTRGGEGVEDALVVLHRVSSEASGAIDSTRVREEGTFSFPLPTVPDPGGRGEIYFASVRHQEILYFGPAIATAVQLDSLYVIEVYDTLSVDPAGADLTVEVRYLIVEDAADAEPPAGMSAAPPDGVSGWQVTDLFQLRNDSDRTLVAREGGVVWRYPLPPDATDVEVGMGDVGSDAVAYREGVLVVTAPLPPGPRQLLVRYLLPGPELRIPTPGTTESMEVLLREPAPAFDVEGLDASVPVTMETGTTYRRFTATALSGGAVVLREAEEAGRLPLGWIAVGLALLLGGFGAYAVMRRKEPAVDRPLLLVRIARLDGEIESRAPGDRRRRALEAKRRALVERLREVSGDSDGTD